MAKFSLWESDIAVTLTRGAEPARYPDGRLIEEGPTLMKVFDAPSWNAARQRQYDHYGWGYYRPEDDWEEIGPDEE